MKVNNTILADILAACALMLAPAAFAAAGNDTWLGNTDNKWSTPANWSPAVNAPPTAGDWLFFGAAGSAGASLTNDLTAGLSIAGITYASGAGGFTFVGNPIVLAGGITNSSTAAQTISFGITNTTGGRPLIVTSGGSVIINGGLYGTGGSFSINGGGTVTIGGASNTQTGTTTVTNSAVVLAANNALPIAQLSLLGAAGQPSCSLDLAGFNQMFSGGTAIVGTDANNNTQTGCFITNSAAGLSTLTVTNYGNNFQFREGNFGGNLKLIFTANNLNNANQGGPGSAFQMQVPGNTYSGGTVISGVGTTPWTITNLSPAGAFPTVGNTNTAILRFGGTGFSVFGSGSITLDNGELWSTVSSTYNVTNPVVVTARGGLVRVENNSVAFSAPITGSGLLALNSKNNTFTFSNDWSGFTGTLAVDTTATGINNGVNIVNLCSNSPAGDLLFWGSGITAGNVRWNGDSSQPVTLSFTRVNYLTGSSATIGRLSCGNASTVTYRLGDNTATTNTFGGIVENGSGAVGVTKIGSDTQILSGANTYTNPTYVGGGTLVLGGVNNGGGGCVVSNGATLSFGGTGSLTNTTATVSVLAGGTLRSGGATIGGLVTLGSGNAAINLQDNVVNTNTLAGGLTLDNGNILGLELGGASDVIAMTGGTYTKNAGTVTVNVTGTGFGPGIYPLITGASITVTNGFVLGTAPSNPSFAYKLVANSGNLALDVSLAVVSPAAAFWKGGVNNNWSTADSGPNFNWADSSAGTTSTGAKPGVTTVVTFSATGAGNQATILGGDFEINSLALTSTANVGIGGANALQLDSGGLTVNSGAGNLTISNASLVLGGSQLWTNGSANTVTVSAPVSGLSTVTLGGGNTVFAGGNSHSGTVVASGKLTLSGSGTLGSGSATVTANAGTIDLGGGSQGVGLVTLANAGVITNGTITGTSYALQSGTMAAVVGGAVVTATKSTPDTVTLLANNTFAGTMVVGEGTLQIGSGGATGTLDPTSLVISNGAALVFNSQVIQTNNPLISGSGSLTLLGGSYVRLRNLQSTFSGNVLVDGSTLASGTQANTANATTGVLGNPAVERDFVITNGGTLGLYGGNTFGGWASTRCGINVILGPGSFLDLAANDSNPLGDISMNNATILVGNGFNPTNQSAILFSNVVVEGSSPSVIMPRPGSDNTRNGVMLGKAQTDATADFGQSGIHFVVNTTGGGGADLAVSARLVDPPFAGSFGPAGFNTNSHGGLYKEGAGTMLLTAVNTYTGPTIIGAGKLVVSSMQSTNGMTNYVAMQDSTTLGVLAIGTNQWSPSQIQCAGNATFEFTGLTSSTIAPLNPGSLSLGGMVTVNVYGPLPVGQFSLVANGAASIGQFVLGTLPAGAVATLGTSGSEIVLNVTTASVPFVWTGLNDANWDTTTANNWKTNSVSAVYVDSMQVQFDDSAARTNVNVALTVSPFMAVSNNTAHYAISSAAGTKITGIGGLAKNGNGVLTLTSLNSDFSGGVTINAGTVEVSGNANLGSGSVQLSGGALSVQQTFTNTHALTVGPSSGSGTGTISVAAGQTFGIPSAVADTAGGTGALNKSGAGALTLSAANTYSGGTVVGGGMLVLSTGGGTGAVRGALIINPGATVQTTANDALGFTAGVCATPINIYGGTLTNSSGGNQAYISTFNLMGGKMSSSGGAYNFNGTNSAINSLATNAAATISGPVQLRADGMTITTALGTVPSGIDLEISGNITALSDATYGFVKAGAGRLLLTGTNTYKGDTTISAGTLELGQSFATLRTNSTIVISNGASLKLTLAAVTNKVAGLVLNGVPAAVGLYNSANGSGYITGSGYLQVGTVTGPTGPGTITNSISGSNMTLTWPSGQGWRLQIQTNSLNTGLGTNWVYLTDGSVSSTNVTVDPAKPTVFYRLVYP